MGGGRSNRIKAALPTGGGRERERQRQTETETDKDTQRTELRPEWQGA